MFFKIFLNQKIKSMQNLCIKNLQIQLFLNLFQLFISHLILTFYQKVQTQQQKYVVSFFNYLLIFNNNQQKIILSQQKNNLHTQNLTQKHFVPKIQRNFRTMSEEASIQDKNKLKIQNKLTEKLNSLLNPCDLQQNQNIFISLNRTLNSLNSDTLKRYNTQNTCIEKHLIINKPKKSRTSVKFNPSYNYQSVHKLIPQPWNDQLQIQGPDNKLNPILTKENNKNHQFCNSFLTQKINQHKFKNIRSSSAADSYKQKPVESGRKTARKTGYLNTSYAEDFKNRAQSFNYTNEQKARVSLDYLVHQKKQKKLSRMLKMKTHILDKSVFKHPKMGHQSKFLIEALQKLSTDNILRKSIDRAFDVLKKRTNSNLYKNVSKKYNSTTYTQSVQVNQISCQKLQPVYESPTKMFKQNYTSYSLKNIQPQLQVNKMSKLIPQKQFPHKVSFKPKRNWIVQTKKITKQCQKIKISQIIDLDEPRSKNSNNFLKINQLHK